MRIVIIGYGKMGKAIEQVAISRGDRIVAIFDKNDVLSREVLETIDADVAIEFSSPRAAFDNIALCIQAELPVVSGTTGWYERLPEVQRLLKVHKRAALLYAPNFSIGVNIAFQINALMAKLRSKFPEYQVSIEETHHQHKVDAPSGTAISLACPYLNGKNAYPKWVLNPEVRDQRLPIYAKRKGEVPGTHTIKLTSKTDEITLCHEAFSREGFAQGAVQAAQYLMGKSGLYTMNNLFEAG